MNFFPLALLLVAFGPLVEPAAAATPKPPTDLKARIVRQYAKSARSMYEEIERRALVMSERIGAFLAAPSPQTLAAAREAWIRARLVYGQSEVLRFYGGPIDGPGGAETLLNAWPVDEAYIDYVRGDANAGIINQVERYPNLNTTVLSVWNQRGGEANVSTGWHAIEFLLWGQDFSEHGAGSRPHTDYVIGTGVGAERRGAYLRLATDLLVAHLSELSVAWSGQPGTYRARLEAEPPDEGVRRILAGMLVLSGFELGGERLAVPFETQDQEDEHSCFSDTTHLDLIANQTGIQAVFTGCWQEQCGAGIRDLAHAVDPSLAAELSDRIAAAMTALQAIEPPFDRTLRARDDEQGRRTVLAAIEALELQTDALATLSAALGYRIPIAPPG